MACDGFSKRAVILVVAGLQLVFWLLILARVIFVVANDRATFLSSTEKIIIFVALSINLIFQILLLLGVAMRLRYFISAWLIWSVILVAFYIVIIPFYQFYSAYVSQILCLFFVIPIHPILVYVGIPLAIVIRTCIGGLVKLYSDEEMAIEKWDRQIKFDMADMNQIGSYLPNVEIL